MDSQKSSGIMKWIIILVFAFILIQSTVIAHTGLDESIPKDGGNRKHRCNSD